MTNKPNIAIIPLSMFQRLDWSSRSGDVVELYQSTILNLVSVHTDYLKPCLKMILDIFSPGTTVLIGFWILLEK